MFQSFPAEPGEDLLFRDVVFEFLPRAFRPFFHVEPELAEDGIHPAFDAPADASAGREPSAGGNVERLAKGLRMKIGGEDAEGNVFRRNRKRLSQLQFRNCTDRRRGG